MVTRWLTVGNPVSGERLGIVLVSDTQREATSMVLRTEVVPSELLRTFLIIERTGSYTEAAEMLGLSQPAISSHMKRLQQIVGGELFERSVGGLSLTRKGETVKQYATRILNLNWQMLRQCGAGETRRSFRIGAQNVFSPTHLMSLQQNLARKMPEHRTVITWARGVDIREDVKAGYLDAAFVVEVSGVSIQSGERWEEKICWVCSRNFVLGGGRPVPLLSWPNSLSDALAIEALSEREIPYTVVLVANDLATHLAALRAGLGVCLLLQRLVPEDLKIASFHFLPPPSPAMSCVYLNEALPTNEARSLREAIEEVMPPNARLGPEAQGRAAEPALT
jgi:DNA-binding transcriptional LysR family regulator